MQAIEKVKIILGLDGDNYFHSSSQNNNITDTKLNKLLHVYIDNAEDYILDYTNLKKVPKSLVSVVAEMAVYQYRQRELENVKSETIGATSYSFTTDYPESITSRLNSHKRVTVV